MWQRFTERARRVVFFAQEEAAALGGSVVDTEHLLLGLARQMDSVAARMLDRMNVTPGRIREEVERHVTRREGTPPGDMQLTPAARKAIDQAYVEAKRLRNHYMGTEHMLLGLLAEGDGLGPRVLAGFGVTLERTRALVEEMQAGTATASSFLAEMRRQVTALFPEFSVFAGQNPGQIHGSVPQSPLELLDWLVGQASNLEATPAVREMVKIAVKLAQEVCGDLKHLRAVTDLTPDHARALLAVARVLKTALAADRTSGREVLAGRTLAMVFEKPSLRTRVSFEAGMYQLGGHALYLQPGDIAMGKRETVPDTGRVLSRMVDGVMARVFAHETILELAAHSRVPVINGLCDREHPCQALADFLTVCERRGTVKGQKIAYVGDGNNVAHSLLLLGARLGAHVVVGCPAGYAPLEEVLRTAREDAARSGGSVTVTSDPREAVTGADVIYTDVWTSMGQEAETEQRLRDFAGFQVDEALCALAKPDHLFLHCLPAHRGEEVSAAVADGPHSAIFDQAENRLHAQKAVLAVLMR